MTTNAFDKVALRVATDSRWSIDTKDYLYFVDDTRFDKIAKRKGHVIVFAGDSLLIDAWKKWFSAHELDTEKFPPVGRRDNAKGENVWITVMLLRTPTGEIRFRYGWMDNQGDRALFAGTGGPYARDCFIVNGCIMKAVKSATQRDDATGGEIKFLDINTGHNNLTDQPETIEEMHTQLHERGFAMDKTTKQIKPIADHNAHSNVMAAIAGMTLSAPTGMPEMQWTSSALEEFKSVLRQIAAEESGNR